MSIRTSLLVIFVLLSLNSFNQITLIPDPNFEQALIFYGYDTEPVNGSVPTANISSITMLHIPNSNISNLSGIQDFAALTDLYCFENQLTTLDISQNTLLTTLLCNDNQLTSLDVSQNVNLAVLDCSINELSSINVSQNVYLSEFYCDQNQLSFLDISENTSLISLKCGNNQLTSLDVSHNTDLTTIWCNSNLLNFLDLSHNVELSNNLYCSYNQLTSLDLSNNPLLTNLACSNNELVGLDLSQNISLTNLNCSYNEIECLNVANGNNNSMTLIALSNPNLTCISVDNVLWSETYWTNIDSQTSFSTDCANNCILGSNSLTLESTKKVARIIDPIGKDIDYKMNTFMIYVYDDGTTEKIFVVE